DLPRRAARLSRACRRHEPRGLARHRRPPQGDRRDAGPFAGLAGRAGARRRVAGQGGRARPGPLGRPGRALGETTRRPRVPLPRGTGVPGRRQDRGRDGGGGPAGRRGRGRGAASRPRGAGGRRRSMTETWLEKLRTTTDEGLESELARLSAGLSLAAEHEELLDLAFASTSSP